MAFDGMLAQPFKSPDSRSLLDLPTEILDQIVANSLIPDRIWVSPIHTTSTTTTVFPVAALSCFVTTEGSQFCVTRFSFSRLMISRALYAYLKSYLWKTTIFNLGRARDAQVLLQQAGSYIQSCKPAHISIALEHAGIVTAPLATYNMLHDLLERHCGPSLRTLEIRVDVDTFAQPNPVLRDLDDSSTRVHRHSGPWHIFSRTGYIGNDGHRRLNTDTLLQACLARFTMLGAQATDQTEGHHRSSSLVVQVPFFESNPARQTLLKGTMLNRHCAVEWDRDISSYDRYRGLQGWVCIRQKSGFQCCCLEDVDQTVMLELYRHASRGERRVAKTSDAALKHWKEHRCHRQPDSTTAIVFDDED